jgi:uncharacterized protein (TIGR03435 family)
VYPRLLVTSAVITIVSFGGCARSTSDPESETALGLTRRLPPEYVELCVEIQREMHVNPCPPLMPDGTMNIRGWSDSLDIENATILNSINGREIDAHGGHWTIWVADDKGGLGALADHMHATGAKTPSQCQFIELEGQRVEACRVPPYPDGGYFGNHVAYEWQRGGVAYDVSIHNHANEPRLRLMMAALIKQETLPRAWPRFTAATIRPCANNDSEKLSKVRIVLNCRTVASLIETAYVKYESGLTHSSWALGEHGTLLTGGPSWFESERYTVDASTDGTPSTAVRLGPMLQTLLEEHFKLKVHYETREVPVYDLHLVTRGTAASGGWPPKPPHVEDGRCVPRYSAREDAVPQLSPSERWCSGTVAAGKALVRIDVEGASIDEFSKLFLSTLPFVDRRIRNRTEMADGRFDFHLEFAPRRDALFSALQEQVGLKVGEATGFARFLVVDSSALLHEPHDLSVRTVGQHVE